MSRQRGTPRRGSSGRGNFQCGLSVQVEEGYEVSISFPVRILIEDSKGRVVNQRLAAGHGGSKINHYWLVKNMLGNIMEEMLGNWSVSRDTFLEVKEKIDEMDGQLNSLDANFAWKYMESTTR